MRRVLLIGLLLLTGACGQPAAAPPGGSDLVRTTPRGLAAVVDAHLDGLAVLDYSGEATPARAGFARSVSASVRFTASKGRVGSIYATATEKDPAGATCGGDSGYRDIVCERDGDRVIEIARLVGEAGPHRPRLIGRVRDTGDRPRAVLVMTYSADPDVIDDDMVRSLLEDLNLGPRTERRFNLAGERLRPFEKSETVMSVTTG